MVMQAEKYRRIRMGSEAAPSYLSFSFIIYDLSLIILFLLCVLCGQIMNAVSWRFFENLLDFGG